MKEKPPPDDSQEVLLLRRTLDRLFHPRLHLRNLRTHGLLTLLISGGLLAFGIHLQLSSGSAWDIATAVGLVLIYFLVPSYLLSYLALMTYLARHILEILHGLSGERSGLFGEIALTSIKDGEITWSIIRSHWLPLWLTGLVGTLLYCSYSLLILILERINGAPGELLMAGLAEVPLAAFCQAWCGAQGAMLWIMLTILLGRSRSVPFVWALPVLISAAAVAGAFFSIDADPYVSSSLLLLLIMLVLAAVVVLGFYLAEVRWKLERLLLLIVGGPMLVLLLIAQTPIEDIGLDLIAMAFAAIGSAFVAFSAVSGSVRVYWDWYGSAYVNDLPPLLGPSAEWESSIA